MRPGPKLTIRGKAISALQLLRMPSFGLSVCTAYAWYAYDLLREGLALMAVLGIILVDFEPTYMQAYTPTFFLCTYRHCVCVCVCVCQFGGAV